MKGTSPAEMNMERRRSELSPPVAGVKVEVKEENISGNDYLAAKGRLQGVLRQLTRHSSSEEETDEHDHKSSKKKHHRVHYRKDPVRSTYLMKLYDRSVDLAKFEEDTPLYPICRAWMRNNRKNPEKLPGVKRRLSSPDPATQWANNIGSDFYHLPPPTKPFETRVPSPTNEHLAMDKNSIDIHFDGTPVPKSELLEDYHKRWANVKKKWIDTAAKNEERYTTSKQILHSIYTKAQEAMND